MTFDQLRALQCVPMKGTENAIDMADGKKFLAVLNGWSIDHDRVVKDFKFADFAHALAFVNAVGWIAEAQDHHPDVEFGWGRCRIALSTHDVGGLSKNDFICAAKIQALLDE